MPDLTTDLVGHVRVMRLNRPERKNALTSSLGWAIVRAVREAQADDDVGVIALTGNGDAFCSGLDLGAGDDDPVETGLSDQEAVLDEGFEDYDALPNRFHPAAAFADAMADVPCVVRHPERRRVSFLRPARLPARQIRAQRSQADVRDDLPQSVGFASSVGVTGDRLIDFVKSPAPGTSPSPGRPGRPPQA